MATERFKIPVYVSVILQKDDQVLLMKRSKSIINGGKYAFPGGGVEKGETVTAATVREALEEIGVVIEVKDLQFVHVNHVNTEQGVYVSFFFTATKWIGLPEVKEPEKCDGLSWFSLNDLPQEILPVHRYALLQIHHRFFTEYGW